MKLGQIIKSFIKDERGMETVEYAIFLGFIAFGVIAVVGAISGWVSQAYADASGEMTGANKMLVSFDK